ncbi:MAG: GumC family protein, partial [Gammaproteobacteria bacterium]|nr:GumC family protein [Gammaproteobacteria bacterium]
MNPADLIYGGSQGMDDAQKTDFLQYWRVIRKHLFGIIGLCIAVGLLAMIYASSLTPIYTASTKVSIEHISPATGGYTDNNWYAMSNYPGTQYEFIKSFVVAELVVESLKLWEHPFYKNPKQKKGFSIRQYIPFLPEKSAQPVALPATEEQLEKRKDGLINMVRGGIIVTPIPETFIVKIGFSSASPELAALIANSVVDAYIQRNLNERFKEMKKVSDWMNKSLGGIATQLGSSEEKLQDYRSKENLVDVGKGTSGFLNQALDELSNRLTSERIKYNELRVLKLQAGRFKRMTLDEVLNNPSIYKHPTLSELKSSEVSAGRNVAELQKRYGPRHPKMKQANAELEAIRSRYKELIPSIIRGIDEDYEVSRQNMASLQQQYDELNLQKQNVNVKAFEIERLQQDVEGNRKLRDLFMEEYKQTSLNSSFETDRVRVVDAAKVPGYPSRPNKQRIIMMWIMLALFAGVGLAFFIEYVDQTIKTSEDVERLLNTPVLGMLPELDEKKIKSGELHPERAYTEDEKSNFSETIRTIRTGLTLSSLDKP